MSTAVSTALPTADELRSRVRDALVSVGATVELGSPNDGGLPASTAITGDVLFTVPESTPADADAAIGQAAEAFSAWRVTPAPVRGALVARLGALLVEHKSALAALVTIEAGKITSEAAGEVQEMIDICDFAVGLSRQLYGKTIASERPGHRLMETWHPLGVVGVITAFNFPVAVWAWNTAVALVCGDTVVWKPSELTPLTAVACQALLERACADVNAPAGVSRLILGGREVGERLIDDPRVALVSATGSVRMGKQVGPRVAERLGKVLLELGGNNGIIALADADPELLLRGVLFGAVGTAGQRCTSTRRLFLHRDIAGDITERLVSAYGQVAIGDPLDPATLMGPMVDGSAVETYSAALETIKEQGGEVLCGGNVLDQPGHYVEPTIVKAKPGMEIVRDETFAPILYLFEFDSLEEAIAMHNSVDQGLSSSIFTRDMQSVERFLSAAGSDCGIANVNIGTSGAEIGGAFGGEKDTGGGREAGSDSWKAYMRRQTNTLNWSDELPLAQGIQFGD